MAVTEADLYCKIGMLTIANDVLRQQLADVGTRLDEILLAAETEQEASPDA